MAIRDIKTDLTTVYSDEFTLSPSGQAFSKSINVRNYDDGIMFIPFITLSDDETNLISIDSIQDSSDDTNWKNIDDIQYIGELSQLQNISIYSPAAILPTLGVFGNEKFLRVSISASSGNVGNITIKMLWVLKGEIRPDPDGIVGSNIILDDLFTNDGFNMLTNDDEQIVIEV